MARYLLTTDGILMLNGSWDNYNADYYSGRCYLSSDGKFDVNLSTEFSILIQNAGRWCEHYASDILYDIDAVKETINQWRHLTDEKTEILFGFRQCGVDSNTFIAARAEQRFNEYRAIYAMEIEFIHDETMGWVMNWEFGRVQ